MCIHLTEKIITTIINTLTSQYDKISIYTWRIVIILNKNESTNLGFYEENLHDKNIHLEFTKFFSNMALFSVRAKNLGFKYIVF